MKKLHIGWNGKTGKGALCNHKRYARVSFIEKEEDLKESDIYETGRLTSHIILHTYNKYFYKGQEIKEDDPRLCKMCIALLNGNWHMPYEKDDYGEW